MKQILLDNAYEAWKNAISYHDRIKNGYSSLEYQKGFVSSLHNAVELFLKQIMLNNNDHDVAWIGKVKSKKDAQLQLDYYNATDLNAYFSQLSSDDLNKYISIEYSKLIDKVNRLISVDDKDKSDFKAALNKLKELRNNETHFYINENSYLLEDDFCKLHNFMIVFYNAIVPKIFNKYTIIDFSDPQKYNLISQYKIMEILFTPLTAFSYVDALKSNKTVQKIKTFLSGEHSDEYAQYSIDDHFVLAVKIMKTEGIVASNVGDYIALLGLMIKYKLFWIEKNEEPIELDNGEQAVNREYTIKFDPDF